MIRTLLSLCCLLAGCCLLAQDAYEITVNIDGYTEDQLFLANNLMDKQYLVDTVYRNEAGSFVFRSDTSALPEGIYLVVLAPDNNYFQMLVSSAEDQVFTLSTSTDNLGKVAAESSKENASFYAYLDFLGEQQKLSTPIREQLQQEGLAEADKQDLIAKMEAFDEKVKAKQMALVKEHPNSMIGAIVKANLPMPPPDFPEIENPEEKNVKQWRWLQQHYFDNIDLSTDRLLRTPFLFERINYYVDKLQIQHPDTVIKAIDFVLEKMDPQSELYKYYVAHFANKAAASKIVGMDAVYVHMVDKYYLSGNAYWIDEEQLAKMKEDADKTRPLLIGKKAPNITATTRQGEPVQLYDLTSEFTILYFWRYDCGACKKSTPHMKTLYEKWKDRGLEIFAVCVKQEKEIGNCWEYVEEQGVTDWLHTSDKYMRYYRDYAVEQTPSIFVLDKNKEIISKRLSAEQLDDFLTNYVEMQEKNSGNDAGR
ncbi:redoxin domain-containing protein [Lewinella sp. W8]|uniref:redoxin domain-containing protein n=1 Tax=Lewinella sp. W8 TaxID=2528208 RepID=UPI0010672EC6|nr:redoxin domain-containing protein [Lewinella sp. W8]MTB50867.1 redoxin domain-containing protein [Lewinella sp. W8]